MNFSNKLNQKINQKINKDKISEIVFTKLKKRVKIEQNLNCLEEKLNNLQYSDWSEDYTERYNTLMINIMGLKNKINNE